MRTRGSKKLIIRMPPDLHKNIKSSAAKTGRSMNGEMCYRLEQSYLADSIQVAIDKALERGKR